MEHHMDINRRVDQILMGAAEDCLSDVLHAPKVRSAVALFFSRVSASMVEMVEEVERAAVSAALVAPKAPEVGAEGGASRPVTVFHNAQRRELGVSFVLYAKQDQLVCARDGTFRFRGMVQAR